MRVKLLAPLEDLELLAGQEADLAANRAVALIEAGYAVKTKGKRKK
jgi:hypothetical protein